MKFSQCTFQKKRPFQKILKYREMIVFLPMSHIMSHDVTYGYTFYNNIYIILQ